jgi:hypothetical protein
MDLRVLQRLLVNGTNIEEFWILNETTGNDTIGKINNAAVQEFDDAMVKIRHDISSSNSTKVNSIVPLSRIVLLKGNSL